jgi:hypothetical protein
MDITDIMTCSTPNIGRHLSVALSCSYRSACKQHYRHVHYREADELTYANASSPGGCKIEMQTFPSSYTTHIHETRHQSLNVTVSIGECERTVGMPHGCLEGHHGRCVRKVGRELEQRLEEAALVQRVGRPHDHQLPLEDVVVIAQTHRHTVRRIPRQI